jgi:hypothetical protein
MTNATTPKQERKLKSNEKEDEETVPQEIFELQSHREEGGCFFCFFFFFLSE